MSHICVFDFSYICDPHTCMIQTYLTQEYNNAFLPVFQCSVMGHILFQYTTFIELWLCLIAYGFFGHLFICDIQNLVNTTSYLTFYKWCFPLCSIHDHVKPKTGVCCFFTKYTDVRRAKTNLFRISRMCHSGAAYLLLFLH